MEVTDEAGPLPLAIFVHEPADAKFPCPFKNVVALAVPPPNLADVTIPEDTLLPFKLVIFEPLIAAAVPVKFAAGILVKFVAAPLNDVAVTIPVTSIPCEFAVTAEPTTI